MQVTKAKREELPYPRLVALLDQPTVTADDLWSVVLYFRSHKLSKPRLAEALGLSYSTLIGALYSRRPLNNAFRERLRKVLAEPLTGLAPRPEQRSPLDRLPDPVHDDQPIPEGNGELLLDHFTRRYRAERPFGEKSAAGYCETIKRYSHWLGRAATLGDLHNGLVNRWLVSLEREGTITKITQHTLRRRLLAVWRHAFEVEAVDAQPLRVRRIRPERRLPMAWNPVDVCSLLAVARAEKGKFNTGAPRAAFWVAFIRAGYETGLRLGDLLELRREQFGDDGQLVHLQSKTANEIRCSVWPETLAAIDSISSPDRPRIFGDVIGRDYLFQQFRRLRKAAGLQGSIKWLRRSGATAVEQQQPGSATAFLGHRSPGLAARSYIDPRQVQRAKPMPPRLEGGAA